MSDFQIDRRFDKPGHESLVDLINESNKTHIKPGKSKAIRSQAVDGLPLGLNTSVRIRLKGAKEGAPSSTLHYRRLNLATYMAGRGPFPYDLDQDDKDQQEILDAVKAQYHVQFDLSEVGLIYMYGDDGTNHLVIVAYGRNPVFYGECRLQALAPDNIGWVVQPELRALTREDLLTGTEIIPAIQDIIPQPLRKLRITDIKL